jgi:hypothetical protein
MAGGVLALLATGVAVVASLPPASAQTSAPDPAAKLIAGLQVAGPIPVTPASRPFGAVTNIDLARAGYVEAEYFVSGRANVYQWNQAGTAAEVRTAGAPYTTRIVVVKPRDPAKFTGRVMVDVLNMTNGWDFNKMWAVMHPHLLETGWGYVGITSRPNAVKALKTFDPQRYAALSWANPLPLDDARNCRELPADSTRETENGLAWDIFAAIGALLKSKSAASPFAGYAVRRVHLTGYSQSGRYLYTYVNAIHPLVRLEGGGPVYDGFLVGGAPIGSGVANIHQCDPLWRLPDPRALLMKHDVPVIGVVGAMDVLGLINTYPLRQDDSDDPNRRYRLYEVTGGSHSWTMQLAFNVTRQDVKQAGFANFADAVPPACAASAQPSPARMHYVLDAALEALDLWAAEGVPAPRAPRLAIDTSRDKPRFVYDETGNQVGGYRLPEIAVPIAEHRAENGDKWQTFAGCWTWSYKVPYDKARLRKLYPSQGDYVAKVARAIDALLAERMLTPGDARRIMTDASNTGVPD